MANQIDNISLVSDEHMNILQSFCKVRYLAECLGHSAFILVFYIAYDIILICLTGVSFIFNLKLGDPFKSHKVAPLSTTPSVFLHIHQCSMDKLFRVADARHSGFAMKIGLECGYI